MEHLLGEDYDYDLLLSKTAKTTLKEAHLRKTCFTFFRWIYMRQKDCVYMQNIF